MIKHKETTARFLIAHIRNGEINCAGNKRLKIYGHLHCQSGKRMKREHRVFFTSEKEAKAWGYRPCGNCMRAAYQNWKDGTI